MGEQTLTIIGFPNRFQIFRANNPSDVFTQKCLCTTQEYFLPLDKKCSEIEELEIRRKKTLNTMVNHREQVIHFPVRTNKLATLIRENGGNPILTY